MLKLEWDQGDPETLARSRDKTVVDSQWAKSHELRVGKRSSSRRRPASRSPYKVTGPFKNKAGLTANVIVTARKMASQWDIKTDRVRVAAGDKGMDPDKLAARRGQGAQSSR